MAELVGGALLGKPVDGLYESLIKLIGQNLKFGSILEQIRSRLDSFKPSIPKMTEVYSEAELQGLLTVIKNGEVLVGKCLVKGSKWNPIKTKRYADQLLKWDESLKKQLEILNFWGVIDARKAAVSVHNVAVDVRNTKTVVVNSGAEIQEIKTIAQRAEDMLQILINERQNQCAENEAYCAVPELPTHTVGLGVPLEELKKKMFKSENSMIVVNAMGGSGKTTLAISFCRDPEVEERFKNNIFFVTVSENFNLELIVQQLLRRKGLPVPAFASQENAVTWLHEFLKKEKDNPLLLVLDDVWPESEFLLGKFQCKEMTDYKILVTSRSQLLRFGSQDCQYKLESLKDHDAMELFIHSTKNPDFPEFSEMLQELSKTIVESCKGLPLALTVVGGSLSGKSIDIWLRKKNELSKGRPPSTPEDELYDCLQRSLDVLDKENKEYFLDLGAFPDYKRISVGALIDIWAELYDDFDLSPYRDGLIHEEEDTLCNAELIKLKSRNLADLVDTRKDKIDEDGYRKGNYVILHDLLKCLAIRQSGLEPEEQRKRLIIDIRDNNIPPWWRKQKYQAQAQARLLSVSTDSVFTKKLPNMTLAEAEVLILNFRTRKYVLPEFVENMPELKVLLVRYNGVSYAELDNFRQLGSLPSLKRITLESLSIRSITENPFILKSLLKMSLILCDLSLAISNGYIRISDALPKLEEMIIDRCYHCHEFLTQCCDLVHLTKLSIIDCRDLDFLPERIGSLVNLKLLRLRSCSNLVILPDSVANLKNLKFLDISECSSISTLPINIGEMSSLIKLDLRHCQDTDELRQSVLRLKQLKEVICTCSPQTRNLWEAVTPRFGRIRILEVFQKSNRFSSGLESANFVLTSDPVHQAWNAVQKQKQINPDAETSLFNEIQQENPTIIVFGTPPSSLQGQEALVSSSNLKEDNFAHFEFLCNKITTNFFLNQAVVKLFQSQYQELLQLKRKLLENSNSKTPSLVIITGKSVGGTVATLFTLWLLEGLDLTKAKPPLCVTFGSPLVGDEQLRQCVLKFSTWKSCFLHIVSDQDPTPQIFLCRPGAYKPFGTFLLCSASGCACFEDPNTILEQLVKANSQNQECHYGQFLGDLKCKALCNVSNCTESILDSVDSLQASLVTQLQAIGILSQQPTEITSLIQWMKKQEKKLSIQKKKISDSHKKLNEMKVYMAFLEWYKKDSRLPKIGGYYDRYRFQRVSDVNVEFKKKLMNYWEDCVTEVEHNPQIEGAHFRFHWLWAGTYYRRMVEPLHIADYYRNGGQNYKTDGKRPRHFIMLEEWLKKKDKPQEVPKKSKRQSVGTRLTEDSCFWAHVEEARMLCNLVKEGSVEEKERALQELKSFEADVYASLENYALSPEIFLEKSSFMLWWNEYKGVVEQRYSSLLLDFMEYRTYEAYKEGEFI